MSHKIGDGETPFKGLPSLQGNRRIIRDTARVYQANRVYSFITWCFTIVGVALIGAGVLLYVATAPPLFEEWSLQRVLVAMVLLISGVLLAGLSRRT